MSELRQIALSKALAMLRGAGTKYIVIDGDGTEFIHGDLKLAPPAPEVKPRTRKVLVPMGTYNNVYEPILKDLQSGQTAVIPYNGLDSKGLQSACTAWCSKQWGKGSTMSHQSPDGLEIMRIA
tara:strand:- start:109 stop:477 length:369 start_codon:yes stop_codon:yes gene_type:complete